MPCWFDQDELSAESAQPCGCDMGCKPKPHYCREHQLEAALADAGIVDDHGTLRWVFKAGVREVSSGGSDERSRLAALLRQTAYLIDDQARRIETLRQRLESIDHSPECNSRFASTCGDSQRCNCGKDDI